MQRAAACVAAFARVAHARRRARARRGADELLAGAGARDGHVVVGPGAGADHRRVADAARQLAAHAAGRRGGGEVAVGVERDRADGAVLVGAAWRSRSRSVTNQSGSSNSSPASSA